MNDTPHLTTTLGSGAEPSMPERLFGITLMTPDALALVQEIADAEGISISQALLRLPYEAVQALLFAVAWDMQASMERTTGLLRDNFAAVHPVR